ncbi:MAG: SDR family NAD(P)-dependent oxidoreductase [Pirellula sp.]
MELELKGNVAVITGGASGIGLASAHCFLAEGASVMLWDVSPDTSQIAQQLSAQYACQVHCLQVDVTRSESVAKAAEMTMDQLGRVDHLVHCAAIGSGKFGFPFTNMKPDDWPRVLEMNIMGMVHVAHAIAPKMSAAGRGTMVFLASVAGQIGSQTDPPYSASKAANINFSQCLAKDLAPHGVRVNTICPGMVRTPLNRSVWQAWYDQAPESERLSYEAWTDRKIKAVVPMGTWQTPDDIASMVVFLSSKRAGQVTGQTINVDGGFVMHW